MQKDHGSAPAANTGRLRHRKRSNEVPTEDSKENGRHLLINDQSKYRSMLTRVYSSIWMIGGFVLIIYMGHLCIWAMVVVIQIFMAKELFNLLRKAHEDSHLPGFRLLNWRGELERLNEQLRQINAALRRQAKIESYAPTLSYAPVSGRIQENERRHFFFTAMLFVYGRILSQRLVNTVTSDKFLYQLMFLLPASLIVINDIAAYFFGFFFGRTPLIKLSPKKTWEGFIGASVTTIISAFMKISSNFPATFQQQLLFEDTKDYPLFPSYQKISSNFPATFQQQLLFEDTKDYPLFPSYQQLLFEDTKDYPLFPHIRLANIMGRYEWLTCPRKDLSTRWLHCDPGPLFKPEYFTLPVWVPKWFPSREAQVLPVQWHAVWLGLFASIIAPFGGFFASGFKRAFKIKDFGDSIPGHGGMTDRMDCQMVMAVFAYIYHQSFVGPQSLSIEMILDQILMNLSFKEQRALYMKLGQIIQEMQFEEF
ncbi:unnamed protein product [Camellia sinensis]